MNFKKKMRILAAGTIVASTFIATPAFAQTVTVQKHDTLWKISQKHHTSVKNIKSINKLKSDKIYVGQKLELNKSTKKTSVAKSSTKKSVKSSSHTYVVKRGDTLSKIGAKYGISYKTIKSWNNLKSNTIRVGQKLSINGAVKASSTKVKQTSNANDTNRSRLISLAKDQLGVPYVWGGTTPKGFDCSGFIYYTLKSEGLISSRTNVSGYWSQATKISNPQAGDLVFFQNTYKKGASHIGIYLENGRFIHAGDSGVQISSVSSSYWKSHFLGYGTFF